LAPWRRTDRAPIGRTMRAALGLRRRICSLVRIRVSLNHGTEDVVSRSRTINRIGAHHLIGNALDKRSSSTCGTLICDIDSSSKIRRRCQWPSLQQWLPLQRGLHAPAPGTRYLSDNRLWHCRRSDPGGRSNEQHATVNDDGLTVVNDSAHQALVRVSPIAHCQTESDGAEVVETI
jgi:hypothetical protein